MWDVPLRRNTVTQVKGAGGGRGWTGKKAEATLATKPVGLLDRI